MTFLDLFAGIGGFRRGMELAGHRCLGFCEWDKYARMSYISMHCITEEQREYLATLDFKKRQKEILKNEYLNGEWCSDDIRTVDASNIPKADCWCFGAPCQSFSIAGKRAGLEGESGLIRGVFRILEEIREEDRPEWLIYENVKGMLSSNRGFDYLAILLELENRGYDIEWQLLNSKLHGVPQNRERVYTIGHFRSRGERKIFPLEATNGKDNLQKINQIGSLDSSKRNNPTPYRVYDSNGLAPCLNTSQGGEENHTLQQISAAKESGGRSNSELSNVQGLQRDRQSGNDSSNNQMFGIDYNVGGVERDIANTVKARYDAGVTNFKQDGTAICVKINPSV